MAKYRAKRKANETAEEKRARLDKRNLRLKVVRAKKKAEKEAQTNLMANAELKTI